MTPIGRGKASFLQWSNTEYINLTRQASCSVADQPILDSTGNFCCCIILLQFGGFFSHLGVVSLVLIGFIVVLCFCRKSLNLGGWEGGEDLQVLGKRRRILSKYIEI